MAKKHVIDGVDVVTLTEQEYNKLPKKVQNDINNALEHGLYEEIMEEQMEEVLGNCFGPYDD